MKKMVLATASMFALAVAGSGVGLAAGMSNTTGNAPTTQVVPNATAMAQGAQVAAPNQQANRVPISGSQKEEVQQELKRAGLYRGDVDGIFGPETRRAIAEFQRQHGLSQTGNARPTDLDRPQSYEQCERL